MTGRLFSFAIAGLLLTGISPRLAAAQDAGRVWKVHDLSRPKPKVVTPGAEPGAPPSDAVVLFDGKSIDGWTARDGSAAKWIVKDGYMQTVPGAGPIMSKRAFGDVQAHIEWTTPTPAHGEGQDRGNSGVYFMGLYEVQVLDSYQSDTYADGQASALYGQHPPLVNASRPPGVWQTYDVIFRRPRFKADGSLLSPTRLTVFHNGVLVQDNQELWGPTAWLQFDPYKKHADALPFMLQDHDHPVRFRNFWVRPLADPPADERGPRESKPKVTLAAAALDRFVGNYGVGKDRLAIVTRQGNKLFMDPFGRGVALELVPQSATRFEFLRTSGTVEFASGSGKAAKVQVTVAGIDRSLDRLP